MMGFPGDSDGRESACNSKDLGSIPELGRPLGGGCNPLQYSCLENPHGQRSLTGYIHGITKSWTCLSTAQHMIYTIFLSSLVSQLVKNPPALQKTLV